MSIRSYPLLSHALSLVGWTSPKRNFTPRQTAVLAHYLGTP